MTPSNKSSEYIPPEGKTYWPDDRLTTDVELDTSNKEDLGDGGFLTVIDYDELDQN